MEKLMSNKSGLVTGAGSGIGRTTAIAFAKDGAKVMVSDFNEESGKETVEMIREIGGTAEFFPCDVSDEEQVKALVHATVKIFGKLDFAFNNAGTNGTFAPITQLDTAVFERVMRINVFGVWNCLNMRSKPCRRPEAEPSSTPPRDPVSQPPHTTPPTAPPKQQSWA